MPVTLLQKIACGVIGGRRAVPEKPLILYDSFTDTDGKLPDFHTPEIKPVGFYYVSNQCEIRNNQYISTANPFGGSICWTDLGGTNYNLSIRANFITLERPAAPPWGEYFYIYFRMTNASQDYWYVRAGRSGGTPNRFSIRLAEYHNPTETVHSDSNFVYGIADNTQYQFRVDSSGSVIRVYFGGNLIIEKTNSSNNSTATQVGIGTNNSEQAPVTQTRIDQWEVREF